MTIGERIRQIRIALGSNGKKMTLEEFGQHVRVSKNTISNIENGRRNLTPTMRKAICDEFHIDENWLLNGEEGEPVAFIKSSDDVAAAFAKENGLENIEEAILREYLQLDSRERETFRRFLKNVIRELYGTLDTDNVTYANPNNADSIIAEKVASYQAELEAQAASGKLSLSQIGDAEGA